MKKRVSIEKGFRGSLWILYLLIVFEILYMISPFALYYYSVYSTPLNILQSNETTAFLTSNILPHFTSHSGFLLSLLNYICWPLVLLGLLLFIISFCQIYWAKFRRKGAVSVGLYKIIRHPQYVSLAVLGLGTTIYWPRFIVYIMYFTMLFLYYFLAKQEEKICRNKFGESYNKYSEQTGMFLPKNIENYFKKLPKILPESGLKRIISLFVFYICYIGIIIFLGFCIRDYSISKINTHYTDNCVFISVAPLEKDDILKAVNFITKNEKIVNIMNFNQNEKYLCYLVPAGWSIPELGINDMNENNGYLTNSDTHGNPNNYNKNMLIILITQPVPLKTNDRGIQIIKRARNFIPLWEIHINIQTDSLLSIKDRTDKGKWEGIPVPIY